MCPPASLLDAVPQCNQPQPADLPKECPRVKDQLLEFIQNYPFILVPIVLLLPFVYIRRYRRFKRRTEHLKGDESSTLVLFWGFLLAALILGGWLMFT